MIALIGYYWYGLVLALLAGLGTAWWVWCDRPAGTLSDFDPDNEPIAWPSFTPTPPMPGAREVVADAETGDAAVAQADDSEAWDAAAPDITAPDAEQPETEDAAAPLADIAPDVSQSDDAAQSAEPEPARDDLQMIRGIGPQLDDLLRGLGVTGFAQIAGWMPEDIERIDGELGAFKGRILRDEWIGQARLLAKGDMATFEQRYGHL